MMAGWKLAIVLLVISCDSALAQKQESPPVGRPVEKPSDSWDALVGQIVKAEGIAWGAYAKGLTKYLVLATGRRVYVRNVNYSKHDLNGRLLQVSGVLRKGRMEKTSPDSQGRHSQGYGKSFDFYYIESLAVKRIDKVQLGQLERSASDWIVVGMDSGVAMKMMARFANKEYGLDITAAPDGSKSHSYQMADDEVLLFYSLKSKVVSVTKIKLNGRGKGGDDWRGVKGYRLPARKKVLQQQHGGKEEQ